MDFAGKITGKAGYPAVTVPCGATAEGAPAAITFIGGAFREAELIALAYAFEQAQVTCCHTPNALARNSR